MLCYGLNRREFLSLLSCVIFVMAAIAYDMVLSEKRVLRLKPINTPPAIEIMQKGRIETVALKKVSNVLLQHTNFVGTADNPTMDGGIINTADGLPVNAFSEQQNSGQQSVQRQAGNLGQNLRQTQDKGVPFQDDWATSERVKNLLQAAVSGGKLKYALHKADEKGLPASVATVPMVESSYQENARSPKGAAGAWQLMPQTAQDYGLTKEERYKFTAATEAALSLLYNLHQEFHSWELTFAAYNAGAKRVAVALRKNPHANSVQELDLPQETKEYVKRIMAINKSMERLS